MEFNETNINKTFHIYLIKSDIIPHFDLLNNPSICCSEKGGSICDDFFNENDYHLKNDNIILSNLLRDHAEFYRDFTLNESNPNFFKKKSFNENMIRNDTSLFSSYSSNNSETKNDSIITNGDPNFQYLSDNRLYVNEVIKYFVLNNYFNVKIGNKIFSQQ